MPHIPKLMIFQSPRFRECSREEYYFRHSWKKKKKKLLIVLLWQNRVSLFALYLKRSWWWVQSVISRNHSPFTGIPPATSSYNIHPHHTLVYVTGSHTSKKNGRFPNFSKMTQILPGFLLLLPNCSHMSYNMYQTYYVSCHTQSLQLCLTFWSHGL